MRKTFIAAAALAVLLGAGSAQAGLVLNGVESNGITINGFKTNGRSMQGISINGLVLNGTSEATATVLLQGITLPGGATLNAPAQ